MRNKKKIIIGIVLIVAAGLFYFFKTRAPKTNGEIITEVKPASGTVQSIISSTGAVLPRNRLEIRPPVNGRIEEVLVKEGERVTVGQRLAWMSSTERAALLDAARGKGEETYKYWQEVYKAIPLISPIDAEVIVAKTQAGQTVTTSDAVVVLSDELIVRAEVDETDIGKIKIGQEAMIILDAYPDDKIKAKVDHIYYESQTVNNVTIYEVDLLPESVSDFFRSGMSATVNFFEESKQNSLLIPTEAITREKGKAFVFLKQAGEAGPLKQEIATGLSDDKNTEVISGLKPADIVLIKSKEYALPTSDSVSSPLMPFRRRQQQQKK